VKVRFDRIGYPLYCDAGPYEGDMRIDLSIRLYLSPEEYARYEGSESLQITLSDSGGGSLRAGSIAEPSGELPSGDVAAAGEAGPGVGRAGRALVRSGLNEVRTSEHGTRPCPHPAQDGAALQANPLIDSRKEPDRP
jgi:hypothetical protein